LLGLWEALKQERDYFLDFFSQDRNQSKNLDTLGKINHINVRWHDSSSEEKEKEKESKDVVQVLKYIIETQLTSSNEEIERLREKVSFLEWDLQSARIQKMNTNKMIDDILKDLVEIPNLSVSEKLKSVQSSPYLNSSPSIYTNAPILKNSPFPSNSPVLRKTRRNASFFATE